MEKYSCQIKNRLELDRLEFPRFLGKEGIGGPPEADCRLQNAND